MHQTPWVGDYGRSTKTGPIPVRMAAEVDLRTSTLKRITIVVIILVAGYGLYDRYGSPYQAMVDGQAALVSNDKVTVDRNPYLVFRPADREPETGLIFYIGSRVPPAAYAPMAREIAEAGFLVAIPSMPFNLPVFGQSAANDVLADFPEIISWGVGGHARGGANAASYIARSSRVDGLLLLGSQSGSNTDLSQRNGLTTFVVYATEDGLVTVDEIEGAKDRLPSNAEYVLIQGGNHAQFGWYGSQSGDGAAKITRLDQQEQTIVAVLDFMRSID